MAVIGEIKGKNILLVDDLTETAGTLTQAAALLKKKARKKHSGLCFPCHFERRGHRKIAQISD